MTTKFRSVCGNCNWMSGHTDDIGDPTAPGWFSWDDEAQPDVCPKCGTETNMQSSEDCFKEIANAGSIKDNSFAGDEENELTAREKELATLIEVQERLIAKTPNSPALILAKAVLRGLVREFNSI